MINFRDAAFVDFETLLIERRPFYPPVPVGVAIDIPGSKPHYYAWGHVTGVNNCSWGKARQVLGNLYDSGRPVVFHNAKFDIDVGEEHMDLPRMPWEQVHDTMPMLFMVNPRAPNYQLKPTAEALLGLAAGERDAVEDWLIKHQPVPNKNLSSARGKNYAGGYVAFCPVSIAGPYALGDLKRTKRLAIKVYKDLEQRSMVEPYDRERRLLYHILEMERQGVRVDHKRLARDIAKYQRIFERIEKYLARKLKVDHEEFNFNSGDQLAEALINARLADEVLLGVTNTGKIQTNKEAFDRGITDPLVLSLMKYRAQLNTCLNTFMIPWSKTAEMSNGLIYTTWHSTRNDYGGGVGARTGRLSSTPNFQNIPLVFEKLFYSKSNKSLPRSLFTIPGLPKVRSYVIPFDGEVLADRDYSQQELRILGHFEDDVLKNQYVADPWMDVHDFAQQLINEMLRANFERKPIKNTGFGIIYGMGIGKLAIKSDTTVEMARKVKDAYLAIFPGLKEMYADMKQRAKNNKPIRTWGGREYYCEEPKMIDGRYREFDYKMLNLLIQGSAADCTKEALIRYMKAKPKSHKVLMTIHDEILISVPKRQLNTAMKLMRDCMESVEFSVPMLSEGKWSDKDWEKLKHYDKKGKKI